MKRKIILFACCFAMLPLHGQAQSSSTKASRQASSAPTESAPYVREGSGTVCTTAPRVDWLPEDEMRLLAEHLVRLEVVAAVSHETVRQALKQTSSSRT